MTDRYRHILLDLDGTVIETGSTGLAHIRTSTRTMAAVQNAMDAGWSVSIATGRVRGSAQGVHEFLGANGDLVCHQGAMILGADDLAVLRHVTLDPGVVERALDFLMSLGLEIVVHADDHIWYHSNGNDTGYMNGRPSAYYSAMEAPEGIADLSITTLVGIGDPAEMDAHVDSVREAMGDTALVTHSIPRFCEVGSPLAGKAKALEWLTVHRNMDRDATVAFGDGKGDIDMLEWAGLAIAVGTDLPDVLAVADESIPGPSADGVAIRIEQLLAA